jgi:hypothetical protein
VGSIFLAAALALAALLVARPGPIERPRVKYPVVEIKEGNTTGVSGSGAGGSAVGGLIGMMSKGKPSAGEGADGKRVCAFPGGVEKVAFESNFVKTSRYTILTFIPLNLFIQFQRITNVYFLVVAIIASTPISPVSGETYWMPLCFVLMVSAVTDAVEDYARHKSDAEENARLTW